MAHALIIGATGGIGGALATALAPNYELTLTGRDAQALGRLRRTLGAARAVAVDVTSELELAALRGDLPSVDLLVYAVGVARPEPLEGASDDAWSEQWRVNAQGFALTLKHLTPALAAGARVVAIGAQPQLAAARQMAGYAASKAALDAIARVAALELRRARVSVQVVRPGAVATELWAPLGGAPKAALASDAVGERIAAWLAAGEKGDLAIDA